MLGIPGKIGKLEGFGRPLGRFPEAAIIGCGRDTGICDIRPGRLETDGSQWVTEGSEFF